MPACVFCSDLLDVICTAGRSLCIHLSRYSAIKVFDVHDKFSLQFRRQEPDNLGKTRRLLPLHRLMEQTILLMRKRTNHYSDHYAREEY